jgi:DNA-binding transcriptional MerR regulator
MAESAMNAPHKMLNINEAAKACGLSPSVLRIWELRYGWPNPKRKTNGYRSYSHPQIQELKRMGELVKSGFPISALIVDGLPRWPSNNPDAVIHGSLPAMHALTPPRNKDDELIFRELLEAFESRRASQINELIQRAAWSVRPAYEAQVTLVPTLIALAELRRAERLPRNSDTILDQVKERSLRLIGIYRISEDVTYVLPRACGDHALAAVTALLMNQRGQPAKPWFAGALPDHASVVLVGDEGFAAAGDGIHILGRISPLGNHEASSLAELLTIGLPWATSAV